MCGSRLSLSLRPRPKAQVRPRSGEWLALARRQHQWPDPAGWGFSTLVDTGLIAERILDQFPADGAEENNLYCNPAPNGDKRHADLRPDLDHEPTGFTRSSIPCLTGFLTFCQFIQCTPDNNSQFFFYAPRAIFGKFHESIFIKLAQMAGRYS
jgi:hypothetical protein